MPKLVAFLVEAPLLKNHGRMKNAENLALTRIAVIVMPSIDSADAAIFSCTMRPASRRFAGVGRDPDPAKRETRWATTMGAVPIRSAICFVARVCFFIERLDT